MEEVIEADKLIVMNQGEIVMEGTPRQVFSQVEQLKSYHLDVPQVTMLAHELRKQDWMFRRIFCPWMNWQML